MFLQKRAAVEEKHCAPQPQIPNTDLLALQQVILLKHLCEVSYDAEEAQLASFMRGLLEPIGS
jgi:hypothetical protein